MNTETYKQKIEAELSQVEKELKDIAVFNEETLDWEVVPEPAGDDTADDNDVADRFEDFEERGAILEALEKRWKELKQSLSNIENGAFGKCTVCGNEIEEDRLDANPGAQTCKEHMN